MNEAVGRLVIGADGAGEVENGDGRGEGGREEVRPGRGKDEEGGGKVGAMEQGR